MFVIKQSYGEQCARCSTASIMKANKTGLDGRHLVLTILGSIYTLKE